MEEFIHISSISELHKVYEIGSPKHPLVSVVRMNDSNLRTGFENQKLVFDLYCIALKSEACQYFGYGRSSYDFEEGTMIFFGPGQVVSPGHFHKVENDSSWMLFFHPDLIRNTNLGKQISQYSFFNYEVNEALHTSSDEGVKVQHIIDSIEQEYSSNIDAHSQVLMNSSLELLLNYCTRFYDRQFNVRTNLNTDIITQFEQLLKAYYTTSQLSDAGLPTVHYFGESMNMSANYLSDLLRRETGRSAQDHIHHFLIERAKNVLLNSNKSISEVAYELRFEYPQYFSKLFKQKTSMSPSEFRNLN